MFYGTHCSILSTLKVILNRLKVPLQRYMRKRSFNSFKICFTRFTVLFLVIWRLFWVDQRYHPQDTCENVHSSALKPVLRHLLFFFFSLWRLFLDQKTSVAKIRPKTFIYLLWNWFYVIHCSKFSTLEVIFSKLKVPLQ